MTETKRELAWPHAMKYCQKRRVSPSGVEFEAYMAGYLEAFSSLETKLQSALEYIKEDKCTCKGHQDKLSGEWDLDMCARCGLIKELESTNG